ncbi:zinc finger protein 569 isoform X2 [Oryzias melastigma]|uniref:zinc finger protein 569 isoform X2 n=1 Tax=Oryzias melastigma TaxID=30732 RepID=UPI000CF8022C|nr:zinc finger protein 569 isoform X2 [Oryzias melastigma]
MDAEAPGRGSRAAALRSFVAERLSAASREILAAVCTAVAVYEEEASGFREELHRQRKQLLELQRTSETSVRNGRNERGSPGNSQCSKQQDSPEEEEAEDEETSQHVDSPGSLSSSADRSTGVRKRRPGRPRVCTHDSSVDLNIRVLEDSSIRQLSKNVMKNRPVVPLTCPRGLQEKDFLNLLRSSVPGLSDKPFDLLTSDRRRRLKPLKLRTPAEIHRVFGCAGVRVSTLYVRLKTQEEPQQVLQTEIRPSVNHTHLEAGRQTRNEDETCGTASQQEVEIETRLPGGPTDVEDKDEEDGGRSQSAESEDQTIKAGVLIQANLQDGQKTEARISTETLLSDGSSSDHAAAHSEEAPLTSSQDLLQLDEELKAHSRTRTKTKTYMCGVCGKVLSNNRSLSRHKKTHSAERPHTCQVCGRGFKLPTTLKQHEKIHTHRERSFLCDVCCKMFLTSKQLLVHMRTHTNEKPFHCEQCGRGFTTRGPLTVHMRVHTGETPYRCPYCGWSFKRKTHLDNHLAVHTGAKPFVCGICGKTCARKTYLTVHMRTHNGERPYKCGACGKGFTQSHCLKTHLKSHQAAG